MIALFDFQQTAADQIAKRFHAFITDRERPAQRGYGPLPYYQCLQALTGSGKTPILADSIAQMRAGSVVEPVVLWISKAKVVVEQTLTNLADGGKYHHLVEGYIAQALVGTRPDEIRDATTGLVLLGTVATFNSKEKGDRRIFGARPDDGAASLWDTLRERTTLDGQRRSLFVVYDEGHNLTDQQTALLLELRPEAILVASATPRLPERLAQIVGTLKVNGYPDEELRTPVSSRDVVAHELVKREVRLGGYITSEEDALSAMASEFRHLEKIATEVHPRLTPKCIYVCDTNAGRGDELKPFNERDAPPVRIWRYLVEIAHIDPAEIAVYCDLRVSPSNPPPSSFVLFNAGENDYQRFTDGAYRHIIFNLALQEGWDDPDCYLAYVEKSMGSPLQVEQVVGRVLRQPHARYYPVEDLNGCGFYIHVDDEGVFGRILADVQTRLSRDLPGVQVKGSSAGQRSRTTLPVRTVITVPQPIMDAGEANEAVKRLLDNIGSYEGSSAAHTAGLVARVVQAVGDDAPVAQETRWEKQGDGLPVTIRWLLRRNIDRQFPAARGICDLADPRFSERVHIGSPAATALEHIADEIVSRVLEYAQISTVPFDPYTVPGISVDTDDMEPFSNALHAGYSGLNTFEVPFAKALDASGYTWCRNPSPSGYAVPLLSRGTKRKFVPDFIVWTPQVVWLFDPKGEHLIREAAATKLISMDSQADQLTVRVCLITQGEWNINFESKPGGFTAWRLRAGKVVPAAYPTYAALLRGVIGSQRKTQAGTLA